MAGEQQMLTTMYGAGINDERARLHAHDFWFPVPQGRIMAPDGHIFYPRAKHHADVSLPSVPVDDRATFVHEGRTPLPVRRARLERDGPAVGRRQRL